ncbi:type III PLP-dependent enzyme [Pseudoroseicyclus tamaricis]|uniref:ornithine decarboxylase n=1 Tax=Pseudoroseicyclus tamaricis TaxID=2705421 RepID=A0A6B2JN93_9RHOB|nr:type III PLP-dependent enzyme [Pseudoroseicyclus tamaricis]NDU99449.1 type III PLP-dependent enzyme [Pseudoroseicyclus tamaricis]
MLQKAILAERPQDWLVAHGGEMPVQFFCPPALEAKHRAFREGFPGEVTFAVKSNPAEAVLTQLHAGGMAGFDVASPAEIALMQRLAPGAHLHYHNPVRSPGEIALAKAAGATSWAVDRPGELEKLLAADLPREAEFAVRLDLPVEGAAYAFSAKFGAGPAEAAKLMRRAASAGRRVSLTFHVGTQCDEPSAWAAYLETAAELMEETGIRLASVNVGGGFPSARSGEPAELAPIFETISSFAPRFPGARLVCEPGRGLVADAFAYAVRIKSLDRGDAILNDGIYGGLSEFVTLGLSAFEVVAGDGRELSESHQPHRLWGPTCDSLDRLPGEPLLPADVEEGDWLLFSAMGAYLYGVNTAFNGYGAWDEVSVSSLG